MLFNSYVFLLAFLPVALAGFYLIARRAGAQAAIIWLIAASLFFYGWWEPPYVVLLLGSVLFNWWIGQWLIGMARSPARSALLAFGIAGNLALLGYFKYSGFFAANLASFTGESFQFEHVVLPLAISFFTFQQIAYIADCHRGTATRSDLLRYLLFVTFFPQLIAGPICHHRYMMPQFRSRRIGRFDTLDLYVGLTIFTIGLFKKVILADGIAVYSDEIFFGAARGVALTFAEAWTGALAYTFQIYFDFSGYSDMAIGLGRMFGFRLPLNFHSPYKATNIIDFWRRWHMTLSRFLRDYLYIPLGGNRKGRSWRYVNLVIVMLLGGLWHGANWTFVLWGAVHGVYLMINHAWRAGRRAIWSHANPQSAWARGVGRLTTFFAVVVAWVLFRAEDFTSATLMLKGMAGLHEMNLPSTKAALMAVISGDLASMSAMYHKLFSNFLLTEGDYIVPWFLALFAIAWFAPNTQEFMRGYRPAIAWPRDLQPQWHSLFPRWRPTVGGTIAVAAVLAFCIGNLVRLNAFIYFQF